MVISSQHVIRLFLVPSYDSFDDISFINVLRELEWERPDGRKKAPTVCQLMNRQNLSVV